MNNYEINPKDLEYVIKERIRQVDQWGGESHDDEHHLSAWVDFIYKQTDFISSRETCLEDYNSFVKIIALGFAAIESLRRKRPDFFANESPLDTSYAITLTDPELYLIESLRAKKEKTDKIESLLEEVALLEEEKTSHSRDISDLLESLSKVNG